MGNATRVTAGSGLLKRKDERKRFKPTRGVKQPTSELTYVYYDPRPSSRRVGHRERPRSRGAAGVGQGHRPGGDPGRVARRRHRGLQGHGGVGADRHLAVPVRIPLDPRLGPTGRPALEIAAVDEHRLLAARRRVGTRRQADDRRRTPPGAPVPSYLGVNKPLT